MTNESITELTPEALQAIRTSRGLSVQDFWERLGYRVQALDDPAQQRHLDSYGVGACYMAKTLG